VTTSPAPARRLRIVVIIAAHNEERSVGASLRSLEAQDRPPDRVVVAADNCGDRTVDVVHNHRGVRYFKTRANAAKKPGALNQAWRRSCMAADLVVCMDADTALAPSALREWEEEFLADPTLGGCSAKFTMLVDEGMNSRERVLVSLQRAEFAKWTDLALKRKRRTSVLAGTACCLRNDALHQIASARGPGEGPWIETSLVEDFELTYRLRDMGWSTKVSGTVRAYTDAMTDLRSLWAQRMKWQTGTVSELLRFGVNRLTIFDWWQQFQGMIAVIIRAAWVTLTIIALATGRFQLHAIWLIPPAIFILNDFRQSFRIPHRSRLDQVIALVLVPQELMAWMRGAWFVASWLEVLCQRFFGVPRRDRWSAQAAAERHRRALPASDYQPAM
jgi:biofilm PGA synthesis N-glycosyltransferase PgaC